MTGAKREPRAKCKTALFYSDRLSRANMRWKLEIEAQRQLDLALRAQADILTYSGVEDTECRACGCRSERLPWLKLVGARAKRIVQDSGRVGEISMVQNVVELRTKLHVADFIEGKTLVQREIELIQRGSVEGVTAQIAEAARLRNCKRRRVEEIPPIAGLDEWIDAWNDVGPAIAPEGAAIVQGALLADA